MKNFISLLKISSSILVLFGFGLLMLLVLIAAMVWMVETPALIERNILLGTSIVVALLIVAFFWVARKRTGAFARQMLELQEQLHVTEARFLAATESNHDAFFIFEAVRDAQGEIIDFRCGYLNYHACNLISEDQENFIGRLLYGGFFLLEDRKSLDRCIEVVRTGHPETYEFAPGDGKCKAKWLGCQLTRLADGIALTVRDITEKKRTENELIHAERFQSAIIDSVSYSIIATDKAGNIITMNNAAQRMLWYEEADLIGKFTLPMLHDRDEIAQRAEELSKELGYKIEPGFEVFVAKARAGLPDEHEWTYIRKGGSRFPVRVSLTELRDNDYQVYGYLSVAYDISEQKRSEEHIRHIALHDALTGLPNRTLFNDRVRVAIEHAKRHKQKVAIALLDVDHFKNINDSLGHHIGDLLLQEVGSRLINSVRVSDSIARMGGDEFAFLLPNIDHPDGTNVVFKKVIKAFEPTVVASNHQLHVTASIGICVYPDDGEDLAVLMRKADTAMYQAKKLGRNNFQLFSPEMERQASNRLNLENEMRIAIEQEGFELFYQPQIDLETNRIMGAEALIRWQRVPGIYVSPMEFIPLAEESGLIVPIGEWIIKTACKQAAIFREALGRPLRIAINVSPRQFRQKNLVSCILSALQDYNIEPHDFEVEITENALMADMENAVLVLGLLRGLGTHVALDDFGTGYSSLSYLSRFPVDRLKIDQSFMKNITISQENASLAKVIVNMAKTLGIPVTAEGVETLEQLDFLRATGCDEVQGYYIGRPMPPNALIQLCLDNAVGQKPNLQAQHYNQATNY
ncbi:putative signaling protein [Methylophilaceae bacterium]|nr:putative signaling protein [Methylophilaceae bacterium]